MLLLLFIPGLQPQLDPTFSGYIHLVLQITHHGLFCDRLFSETRFRSNWIGGAVVRLSRVNAPLLASLPSVAQHHHTTAFENKNGYNRRQPYILEPLRQGST